MYLSVDTQKDGQYWPFETSPPVIVDTAYSMSVPHGVGASYIFSFPKNYYQGRTVALTLPNSARLDLSDDEHQDVSFQEQRGPCSDDERSSRPRFSASEPVDQCQLITTVVPASSTYRYLSSCLPRAKSEDYVQVRIGGIAESTRGLDWAHNVTTIPAMTNYSNRNASPYPLRFDLEGTYAPPNLEVCGELLLDPDVRIIDVHPTPTTSADGVLTWARQPFRNRGVALIEKQRDAEAIGNVLLAAVGALAGLSIGFIPVAVDEWEKLRVSGRRETPP